MTRWPSAHKVVKLSPVTQTSLLFDVLLPYLSAGATAANARQVYLKGAYALRSVAETLNKGLILESFAIASSGSDAEKKAAKVKQVTEKYGAWLRAIIDNSFLPFAERLATFYFKDEYLGGHDTSLDANFPLDGWKPSKPSILQSADELAAKLMGKNKSVTLRVLPHVPPIADKIPASKPRQDTAYPGTLVWEVVHKDTTSLTKENILDKLEQGTKHFFEITRKDGRPNTPAESVRRVDISFADGAEVPKVGFDKNRPSFLRYQYDLGTLPDDGEFYVVYDYKLEQGDFKRLLMKWQRYQIEEGRKSPLDSKDLTYGLLTDATMPRFFKLPPEGQLSPVLVTYGYAKFWITS